MILAAISHSWSRPALAIGVLVALLTWESVSPFFPAPHGRDRIRHGTRNVLFGVVNAVTNAVVFVGLWWLTASWSEHHRIGLLHWVSWPPWVETLLAILLLDAWTYGWHRMNHRIPFLWRFHRVHHSDIHMDVTTANRFHTGEIVMSSMLRIPLIGLLGINIGQLALYEIAMFSVVQFHHANIGLTERWDRVLRVFIVTPFMHKVHHSRWQQETDSNYSSLLSIWDRLFRSFRHRDDPSQIELGLDEFATPQDQKIRAMMTSPFRSPQPADRSPRRHDTLIVMTRLPREGHNKTRLIPALGPAGAAEMHDQLARHAIGRASAHALMHPGTRLQVCMEGGSTLDGRAWLGEVDIRIQQPGDLGERLQAAVEQAFSEGANRVVVTGTDCPAIDEIVLETAFAALDRADIVFGPAADGGYYLVGTTHPCPAIFQNIDWGGPHVLNQSIAAAAGCELQTILLEVLPDVDVPADLPAGTAALSAGNSLSVIVPTLNEASRISELLDYLKQAHPHEIIVADGGSNDATVAIAERAGVRVITTPRGRASQMNSAAAVATGEFLLFLHADTLPPRDFPQVVRRVLQMPKTSSGAFRFELAGDLAAAPLIEALVHLRCRLFGIPYGDQGLFLRRRLFRHLGGFPAWPVMEDLHLVRQLKRLGPVRTAAESAVTSSRRWETGGTVRTFLRHQLMLAAYALHLPPRWIARL